MNQRSKDFRAGFGTAVLVVAMLCLSSAIAYDLGPHAPFTPSNVVASIVSTIMAIAAVGGVLATLRGVHEPSKGETSDGRDDA